MGEQQLNNNPCAVQNLVCTIMTIVFTYPKHKHNVTYEFLKKHKKYHFYCFPIDFWKW